MGPTGTVAAANSVATDSRRLPLHSKSFALMSELVSRVYLATETIVICFPLTVLLVVGVLPAQIYRVVHSSDQQAVADLASGVVLLAAVLCLWRLMAAFVARGSAVLRRLSGYWWLLPLASAALVARMAVHSWSVPVTERSWLNALGWGVPFLIPLLHLCAERWLRSSVDR